MDIIENKFLDCGWGKILFGETYNSAEKVAIDLKKEKKKERNILFYPLNPQILLTNYPQDFFLNPAYTYKIDLTSIIYKRSGKVDFSIRKADCEKDIEDLNRVYEKMKMQPLRQNWLENKGYAIEVFIVEDNETLEVLGGAIIVDHFIAWKDIKKSVSLWSLVVNVHAKYSGIGKKLLKFIIQEYKKKKRKRLFLSVTANNLPAQKLYEYMGFVKTPILTIKNKTSINQSLFISNKIISKFSYNTKNIIQEALKRGIQVEQIYKDFYSLNLGGISIKCEESLSELTSSITVSQCRNSKIFFNTLKKLGINYPKTEFVSRRQKAKNFLNENKKIILKTPFKNKVSEEIFEENTLFKIFSSIYSSSSEVLLQKHEEGSLYKILVIDNKVISVVESIPPMITGDGKLTIKQLIKKISRRKIALSEGMNKIPLDSSTRSFISKQGYSIEDTLLKGKEIQVRKTANYHTGGTMKSIDEFPLFFKKIAIKIAKKVDSAVLEIEMIIPDLKEEKYFVLEANIKPHLSYYSSNIVYSKFIDTLFPRTKQ
jgi:GNAT-family acetyltransferase (TIGR03103 family)